MQRSVIAAITLIAAAQPLAAAQMKNGFQIIEDFEARALGPISINFCGVEAPEEDCLGVLSGGSIADATMEFPAMSGTQVYVGTAITLDIADKINYSWPGARAFVSGTAPIRLRAWGYDPETAIELLVADISTFGSDINTVLGIGTEDEPQFLTRVTFSSNQAFAMDDLAMGLVDVMPGIPEPTSWAMLIAGFGLTGGALRLRRAATAGRMEKALAS